MDQDQDRRLSMQFAQPVTASDLEEVDQPDVDVSHGLAGYVSGPSTPLSLMEDRKKSHEEAVRNIDDPVDVKAKFLLAVTDKDQDGEAFAQLDLEWCTYVLLVEWLVLHILILPLLLAFIL